ncbi:helix-turn-helix domain-containing protein [Micromonospora echinospora]|uniref:helix-turn-helix domain-containing protein n=1 Tax=Micromonospora echinospora TaxID=1877 RepID=UPI00341099F5
MAESELPIGRRVAQWRMRRRMSQQVFADRIGKSKSWVDKIERGVRALDRFSVIEDIASVLRVDPVVLLGRDALPPAVAADAKGVEGVRAALALYNVPQTGQRAQPAPTPAGLARNVEHAWLTYQHARYPQLLRMLPDLLDAARRARAQHGEPAGEMLVQVYRVTSSVLVKLGEADLAWLAADRATATADPDPLLTAAATVSLGQALRALGRGRLAMTVTIAAAHRIAPPVPHDGPPDELSVLGTLLLQAALAAAGCGDERSVHELIDQAAEIAEQVGDGYDHQWTNFGPTVVELARIAAAVDLGDAGDAVTRHEKVTSREQWRRLPAEHRAAHLLDVARAYLQVGDLAGAGRVLVAADHTAPAEIRRPAARTVLAEVARGGAVPADVARLAAAVGVA